MKPISIRFDISDVVGEFSLNESQVKQLSAATSKAVTLEIYRNWIDSAEKELKSTRNGYIRGLILSEEGDTQIIRLAGRFNNMIENGCSAFDMKTGFMKSAKVHWTKTGKWYLTIPMRFGAQGTLGESSAFSSVLPAEIYEIVKNYQPQKTDVGGNKSGGESLSKANIPTEFQAPKSRNSVINDVIGKTFDSYTHKSSIFEGVQKSSKQYESANQGSYNSFRRVGANSDPMSWVHGGLPTRNLSAIAIQNTDVGIIVDNTVDKVLAEFGF